MSVRVTVVADWAPLESVLFCRKPRWAPMWLAWVWYWRFDRDRWRESDEFGHCWDGYLAGRPLSISWVER